MPLESISPDDESLVVHKKETALLAARLARRLAFEADAAEASTETKEPSPEISDEDRVSALIRQGKAIAEQAADSVEPDLAVVNPQFRRRPIAHVPFLKKAPERKGHFIDQSKPAYEGWLLSVSYDRAGRGIGAFLTKDGRIGIFDRSKSPEPDENLKPLLRKEDREPRQRGRSGKQTLALNKSVYASATDHHEDGVVFLDALPSGGMFYTPRFLKLLVSQDPENPALRLGGLAAIEADLSYFAKDHGLADETNAEAVSAKTNTEAEEPEAEINPATTTESELATKVLDKAPEGPETTTQRLQQGEAVSSQEKIDQWLDEGFIALHTWLGPNNIGEGHRAHGGVTGFNTFYNDAQRGIKLSPKVRQASTPESVAKTLLNEGVDEIVTVSRLDQPFGKINPDSEMKKEATIFVSYEVPNPKGRDNHNPGSGQTLKVRLFLPESEAMNLIHRISDNPRLMRELNDRFMSNMLGAGEAWDDEKPQYEKLRSKRGGKSKIAFRDSFHAKPAESRVFEY